MCGIKNEFLEARFRHFDKEENEGKFLDNINYIIKLIKKGIFLILKVTKILFRQINFFLDFSSNLNFFLP